MDRERTLKDTSRTPIARHIYHYIYLLKAERLTPVSHRQVHPMSSKLGKGH